MHREIGFADGFVFGAFGPQNPPSNSSDDPPGVHFQAWGIRAAVRQDTRDGIRPGRIEQRTPARAGIAGTPRIFPGQPEDMLSIHPKAQLVVAAVAAGIPGRAGFQGAGAGDDLDFSAHGNRPPVPCTGVLKSLQGRTVSPDPGKGGTARQEKRGDRKCRPEKGGRGISGRECGVFHDSFDEEKPAIVPRLPRSGSVNGNDRHQGP
jgi:hypothetical protein